VIDGDDVVGALARTGVVLATIALALVLWAWALRRHVKGRTSRAVTAKPVAPTRALVLVLVPAVLHRLPAGATLAAASQQLRYYFFRAPRAAQFVVLGPVIGIMFGGTQIAHAGLPFAASVAAVAMGASGLLNLFGYDGRGVELTVQTGAPLSGVLRGKLLAVSLFLVPAVAALTVGFGLVGGAADQIPLALLAAYSSLLLAVAIGAATSVWNPFDQESPQGDRMELSTRMMLAFVAAFGIVYGAAWLSGWADAVVPVWVILSVAFVATATAAAVTVRVGGRFLDRYPERLLDAFTPR
jgi:ABC-2 type transport system permease protein